MSYIFFVKGERFENPNDFYLTYTSASAMVVQNSDVDGDGRITYDEVNNLDTYLFLANRKDVQLREPLFGLGRRVGRVDEDAGLVAGLTIGAGVLMSPTLMGIGMGLGAFVILKPGYSLASVKSLLGLK